MDAWQLDRVGTAAVVTTSAGVLSTLPSARTTVAPQDVHGTAAWESTRQRIVAVSTNR
ncbi:hypothetical protein [Nocardia sp. NPDC003979]